MPEKDEHLLRLQVKYKRSRLQIKRPEKKISEKGGIKLNTELNEDMKQIVTENTTDVRKFYEPDSFQCLFGSKKSRYFPSLTNVS